MGNKQQAGRLHLAHIKSREPSLAKAGRHDHHTPFMPLCPRGLQRHQRLLLHAVGDGASRSCSALLR